MGRALGSGAPDSQPVSQHTAARTIDCRNHRMVTLALDLCPGHGSFSAPAEDSAAASFAGLHDSFVNVYGLPAILDRLRLVWASLWSGRALLYRQELGLVPAAAPLRL